MGTPEGSQRISVIHSRSSVICNHESEKKPTAQDTFDNPYRDEQYNSMQLEQEDSRGLKFGNKSDYKETRRQDGQIPNLNKSHFPRYYSKPTDSQLESSPSTSPEWNNPPHHSYLTNPDYQTPHLHTNKLLSQKISFKTQPYESPSRRLGENYGISDGNENGGSSIKSWNISPNEKSCMLPESPKLIKLECPADLKEKVGNKPVSNCHVCGDLAIAHMHYGGVCCYSCKAFFRRATQTGKDKKYKCKNDKQCSITFTNRRACQYCRFHKCLNIGMKANWVLSDEQCNIRFRKVRKDKSVNNANDMPREGTNSIEIKTVVKEECPAVSKGLVMPFTNEEAKSIEFMVDSYTLSKETFVFSEENDILWNKMFNKSQTERKKHDYTTFDLGSLIMTVIKKNIFFVKTNDKFDSIVESDKMALLQKNMSEMCHLRGAIRFDTKSKNFVWYFSQKDQLQMSFEKGSGSKVSSSPGMSNDVTLRNALIGRQDMSKFYKDTTSQQIFGIVNKLCEIGLPMEVFLILINIVLFSSDNIILENRKEVENNQTYYMLFLHRYLNELFGKDSARMKLSQIMGVLVDLRELCERSKENELQRIRMKREQL
eukprot:GFUD01040334.1.p1 GENE.GFUD01040334.1~~GFUD01040334.1.p1  ORF type:complete len:598 (-),score=135.07 GFUD01040334.1:77-1870(-)